MFQNSVPPYFYSYFYDIILQALSKRIFLANLCLNQIETKVSDFNFIIIHEIKLKIKFLQLDYEQMKVLKFSYHKI